MINALTGSAGTLGDGPKPTKTAEAASQFEALLIAQMLRSARETEGNSTDHSGASLLELGEQQIAQMLASQGGLGISQLVQQGLTPADQK